MTDKLETEGYLAGTPAIKYGSLEPMASGENQERPIIPDVVFETFDDLISRHVSPDGSSTFYQEDVNKLLRERGVDLDEAYDKQWLAVEEIYGERGWNVTYHYPVAYDYYHEPLFTFRPREISPTA